MGSLKNQEFIFGTFFFSIDTMEMIAFYHQAESSILFWFSCDLETLPFKLTETRILSLVNGRTDSFSLITNSSKLQRGKTNNLDKKKRLEHVNCLWSFLTVWVLMEFFLWSMKKSHQVVKILKIKREIKQGYLWSN